MTPILFYGDSPDLKGGLSRIGKDLAFLTSSLPEFKVGYFGRGGLGTSKLPFPCYNFPEDAQWGENHLERAWRDFARGEKGIIFTIWDASRLQWFANPIGLPEDLTSFLTGGYFKRWGYFPLDARSPGGLSIIAKDTIKRYDRTLAYGAFGAELMKSDWLPHGINTTKFQPRPREVGRGMLEIDDEDILIGCVMTNQFRKDWGLAFTALKELNAKRRIFFWCHTDTIARTGAWDLRALSADFGTKAWTRVTQTGRYDDVQMSHLYSACDLTILPSLGEGFGYPIVESLSCGVPVVTGNYAGGAELIPDRSWLVDPYTWRLEGLTNNLRPVYRPEDFVQAINKVLEFEVDSKFCRQSVQHLDWKVLWPSCWSKYLLAGLEDE